MLFSGRKSFPKKKESVESFRWKLAMLNCTSCFPFRSPPCVSGKFAIHENSTFETFSWNSFMINRRIYCLLSWKMKSRFVVRNRQWQASLSALVRIHKQALCFTHFNTLDSQRCRFMMLYTLCGWKFNIKNRNRNGREHRPQRLQKLIENFAFFCLLWSFICY